MNKKLLLTIGKWAAMGILMASNFFFYIINETKLNLILSIIILGYSFFEFLMALSGKNLKLGIKMYLITFYMMAILMLFMSVRSFLSNELVSVATSVIIMAGDIALIVYTTYRLTHKDLDR